jgi:hypothetical protein
MTRYTFAPPWPNQLGHITKNQRDTFSPPFSAECDDRDRTTREHIARVICEAGHMPTTRQGSDAAEMEFREAANLLIGADGRIR